ncbi:type VI secretion system baseplate subunit TssF [candidate division KSB1 bacterium]|nr:type VI secretion system baseplate subunit TssF [candidate division KSB1 bacterium]
MNERDNIERYFEQEYNYLQTAGEEFGKKNQTLGGKLRLFERQRKDPFVERLFEGFAFLAGRIHERLDDDLPEITGGLLEQLFPHFLRPFPSCAILEAKPRTGAVTKPVLVPRGSEVQTQPGKFRVKYKVSAGAQEMVRVTEKDEATEFIFRTTQALTVRPMRLKDVRVEDAADSASALILHIQPDRNVSYETLNLKPLRLYLHGAESIKYTLLLYLTKYVKSIAVRELVGERPSFQTLAEFRLGIAGLSPDLISSEEDLSLVPYARSAFTGYRLLQEYFAYPERFFFVDIEGLEAFPASRDGHAFEIKITFERNHKLPREKYPSAENLRLHCTPIVNLFDRPTEEVEVNQRLPEYYIIPDLDRRKSREIYAVKNVTGVSENKVQLYKYTPVTSYDILDTTDPEYEYKRFYSIVRRPERGDMAATHIRLFGPSMEEELFPKETLSIAATLSNGFLPASYLEAGALKEPINFPSGLEVANLTTATEVLECPTQHNFLWALISHLTLSYSTLAETETLKSMLSLYNWSPAHNNPNKKRIHGITKVYPPQTKSLLHQRQLLRGIEFKLEVDPQHFENGEGDIHLFGTVLNSFLAQYLTINAFVFLTIIEAGSGKEYKWEPSVGKISIV